jgi:hypothetical protein
MEPTVARQMHRTLEPYHGMIYFVPEGTEEYRALGLDDRGAYFVVRAAAMGAVPAEVVIATFYNFEPGLVHRAIDGVWDTVDPATVVDARYRAADRALRRVLGDVIGSAEVEQAAALAREATEGLDPAGRPLFAAHASVDWPDEPHLDLWHALTLLREYRGDVHVAALVMAGVGPCDALVLHAGTGEVPVEMLRLTRAWSDRQWADAIASLAERGLVEADGALTEKGAAYRDAVEQGTDMRDLAHWEALGEERCQELRHLVRPWSKAIVASGTFGLDALPG